MKRKELERIKDTLSVLEGVPLRNFSRSGAMLFFRFGDIVEVNGIVLRDNNGNAIRDDEGNVFYEKHLNGMYALDTLCSMRFTCGNDVIFAKSDIFLPTEEIARKDNFVWDTFDWHTHGNTLFDELVLKHFRGEFHEYIVKSVKVGKFGDLTICFENGFLLEFFADGSGYSENWRFGKTNSTESLVITSKGIIDDDV